MPHDLHSGPLCPINCTAFFSTSLSSNNSQETHLMDPCHEEAEDSIVIIWDTPSTLCEYA